MKARQDAQRPGDFNEALMDLGATVCIPGQPRCEECPLSAVCMAKATGKENEIPLRITKKAVPVEQVMVFVVRTFGNGSTISVLREMAEPTGVRQWPMAGQDVTDPSVCYLLHRRPAKGLLADMWEFPNCVGEVGDGKAALKEMLAGIGVEIKKVSRPIQQIKHVFSHKIWQMTVCEAVAEQTCELPADWCWVTAEQMTEYNLAGPHNKILGMIHQ